MTELEPLLLNMVNQCIETTTFPDVLKTTKIIPIQKKDKDKTTSDAWHPINIVPALSKIVEHVLMRQILQFLQDKELINHSHHGGLKFKSTQTQILEVHDGLVESLSTGNDAALLILDQSKAYDIIQHSILLDKLQILGIQKSVSQVSQVISSKQETICTGAKQRFRYFTLRANLSHTGEHFEWDTVSCPYFGYAIYPPQNNPQTKRIQTVQQTQHKDFH